MKHLILALLMVVLAVLLIPGLRTRAQPHIDVGREWLGDKLEGPLSPVLNRYWKLKTDNRLNNAQNELVRRRNLGSAPPAPTEFRDFLVRHDIADKGLDGWGLPLVLEIKQDSLVLRSAGADRFYDTPDDLTRVIPYRGAGPRLRRGSSR